MIPTTEVSNIFACWFKDVNLTGGIYRTALQAAAYKGVIGGIEILLEQAQFLFRKKGNLHSLLQWQGRTHQLQADSDLPIHVSDYKSAGLFSHNIEVVG